MCVYAEAAMESGDMPEVGPKWFTDHVVSAMIVFTRPSLSAPCGHARRLLPSQAKELVDDSNLINVKAKLELDMHDFFHLQRITF